MATRGEWELPSSSRRTGASEYETDAKSKGKEVVHAHEGNLNCWHASALLLADVFGTGVLGLPHAAGRLGWILASCLLVLFGVVSTYAGILLARVHALYPEAHSYTRCAEETVGMFFGRCTWAVLMINWGLVLPVYMVTTTKALAMIWPHTLGTYPGIEPKHRTMQHGPCKH